MKETDAIDEYILQHIDEESDYLKALIAIRTSLLRPRMAPPLCRDVALEQPANDTPCQVLGEIGTYSGYSRTLPGRRVGRGASKLPHLRVNDEQETLTRPWLGLASTARLNLYR